MASDRMRESFHVHSEAADVITHLVRYFPIADAFRDNQSDRLQALPQSQPRQIRGDWHLDVSPRFLATVSRLPGLMLAGLDARDVVLPLLDDVIDDRLV